MTVSLSRTLIQGVQSQILSIVKFTHKNVEETSKILYLYSSQILFYDGN